MVCVLTDTQVTRRPWLPAGNSVVDVVSSVHSRGVLRGIGNVSIKWGTTFGELSMAALYRE